jgi:hypothetical protein
MKRSLSSVLVVGTTFVALLGVLFVACDSVREDGSAPAGRPNTESFLVSPIDGKPLQPCDPAGKLAFPAGTTFTNTSEGIQYQLPEGFQAIVFQDDSRLYLPPGGAVKCTYQMDGGGGCWPVKAGDYVGCYTEANNPCTKCLMEVTTGGMTLKGDALDIHIGDRDDVETLYGTLGVLVLFSDIHPQFSFTEMHLMPSANEALLSDPEVADELVELVDELNPGNIPQGPETLPPGYVFSPVSVKGHLAYVVVSEEKARAEKLPVLPLTTDRPYCTGCDDQCKAESMYGKRIWYCTGCTSGCELHY